MNGALFTVVGPQKSNPKGFKRSFLKLQSKLALATAAAFLVFTTFHYKTTHAMPLGDSLYPATLPADYSTSHQKSSSSLSTYFYQESQSLSSFCEAWNSQISRGARDSFSWVQELIPIEGLIPFSMAIPTLPHGGTGPVGRTLERRGTLHPELTEDLLDALDQAGPNSVFIDIGAGLGWFSFVAAAANHPAFALENENLHIAAIRRSSCVNSQQNGNFILLGGGGGTGSVRAHASPLSMSEMVLNNAPKIIEALSPPAPPQERPVPGPSHRPQENGILSVLPRGSAALVHPPTTREALQVMLTGSRVLWPEIKALILAMVLPAEKENSFSADGAGINYKNEIEEQEIEELASLVLHKMYALGYDVRMDASNNMAQAPAAFASLAAMVARGGNAEAVNIWFTWKGKKF